MTNQKVIEGKDNSGQSVKVVVKRPNKALVTKAQQIYSQCVRLGLQNGLMFAASLDNYMKEQKIWGEEQESQISEWRNKIFDLTQQLKSGKDKDGNTLKVSEGKNIAYEIRILKNKINELNAVKNGLADNTVESVADNSRFDFLATNSIFREDGSLVFNNVEEYSACSDQEYVQKAAYELMSMLYNIDGDWMKKTTENSFLIKFGFIDEETLMSKDLMQELKKIEEEEKVVTEEPIFVDDRENLGV